MRQKTILACSSLVAVAAISMSLVAPQAMAASPGRGSALQGSIDQITAAGGIGVVAESRQSGHHSTKVRKAVSGLGDIANNTAPMAESAFRVGSLTKTYVAIVLLQLAKEHDAAGKPLLSLDEPVSCILPSLFSPDSPQLTEKQQITVRQLLQHTSGIDDNQGYYQELLPPATYTPDEQKKFLAAPSDIDKLINSPLDADLKFAPGSNNPQGRPNWMYSDAGYDVAGLVIEAVTGHSWQDEVTTRIIDRLGLHGTSIPAPYGPTTLPVPHTQGYQALPGVPDLLDITEADRRTWVGASGQIASTTADTNTFYRALFTPGKLLDADQIREMQQTVPEGSESPGYSYGLGLEKTVLSCDAGKPDDAKGYWGHTGRVLGYVTLAGQTPDGKRNITLSINGVYPAYNPDGSINQDESDRKFQAVAAAASKAVDTALC
ncbi:beta-lactamase family protein (plasmid) [Kitasatospora sp. NBC_00070]|uniref:serine hydrolase domain-containing protein n=1 Tax=Kitasatospora sp. NBC_00070 TaxID=2975962 RepID=UPI002F907715